MAVDRTRKARGARRRKRRMAGVEHDLSGEQWAALKQAWGGCAYCGATGSPLQRDCVQALSRGGRYTLENIAPACGSCNASKSSVGVEALSRGDSELALVDEVVLEVLGQPLLPRVRVRGGNVVRGAEPDDIEDLERAYRSAGADTPRLVAGLGIGEAVQEKGAGRVQ